MGMPAEARSGPAHAGPAPRPALPSFCIEVTRTLVELGVPFVYYRVDQMAEGAQVRPLVRLCEHVCLCACLQPGSCGPPRHPRLSTPPACSCTRS